MIYAAIAAGLWLVGFLVLPVGRWRALEGRNARNWPGFFLVDPSAPCPAAVWAQELYEARAKWRGLPVLGPLFAIGRLSPRLAVAMRRIELMGHEVEVQAEVRLRGLDADGERMARLREARSLATHYRAFRGWPEGRIIGAMLDRREDAKRWVKRNWREINEAAIDAAA